MTDKFYLGRHLCFESGSRFCSKVDNEPKNLPRSERTKKMEPILNFQVPAEGLELVILLLTYTVHNFGAP